MFFDNQVCLPTGHIVSVSEAIDVLKKGLKKFRKQSEKVNDKDGLEKLIKSSESKALKATAKALLGYSQEGIFTPDTEKDLNRFVKQALKKTVPAEMVADIVKLAPMFADYIYTGMCITVHKHPWMSGTNKAHQELVSFLVIEVATTMYSDVKPLYKKAPFEFLDAFIAECKKILDKGKKLSEEKLTNLSARLFDSYFTCVSPDNGSVPGREDSTAKPTQKAQEASVDEVTDVDAKPEPTAESEPTRVDDGAVDLEEATQRLNRHHRREQRRARR